MASIMQLLYLGMGVHPHTIADKAYMSLATLCDDFDDFFTNASHVLQFMLMQVYHTVNDAEEFLLEAPDIASIAILELHRVRILFEKFATDISKMKIGNPMKSYNVWRISSYFLSQCLFIFRYAGKVSSVAFSLDNMFLAVATENGDVFIYAMVDGELVNTINLLHSITCLAWYCGDDMQSKLAVASQNNVYMYDVNPILRRFTLNHLSRVQCLAVSPNGTMIATGTANNMVQIWDVRTGVISRTLRGHESPVSLIKWHDDIRLSTETGNHHMKEWNIQTGVCTGNFLIPQFRMIAEKLHDGTSVMAIGNRISVSNRYLTGHTDPIRMMKMSPDGCKLVSACNNEVRVWF